MEDSWADPANSAGDHLLEVCIVEGSCVESLAWIDGDEEKG